MTWDGPSRDLIPVEKLLDLAILSSFTFAMLIITRYAYEHRIRVIILPAITLFMVGIMIIFGQIMWWLSKSDRSIIGYGIKKINQLVEQDEQ